MSVKLSIIKYSCIDQVPSRSARRRYVKRRLKKELKARAGELHNVERNDGNTATNEACHIVSNSTISGEKASEMNLQKEVLPNDICQLVLSHLSVPEQEATEIAEMKTITPSNGILTIKLQENIESRSNQVMREGNSSIDTQLDETQRDLKRKQKEIENSISSKNKQLEVNHNATTCEPNSGVSPGKFPSRSARRRYAKRQLKKEMKAQGELQNIQQNDGDTTMNETCHPVSNSTISDDNFPEMNVQKEVLQSDIYRLASSNLSVPQQEATEIAEMKTVPSRNEIHKIKLQKIIESRSNQFMRGRNSYLETQLAEAQSDLKRKQKKIENSRNSKNEQLEEKWNATTREPNSSVPLKKFPSRSARRKYAQRQLKKEMRKRARGSQDMQTNGGDMTTNDMHRRVHSRHESLPHTDIDIMQSRAGVDAVGLERFHQDSNFARVECELHHPAPYFPSGSDLRECTRRQLKKDLRKLQITQRNGGDITMKELSTPLFYSGHQTLPPTYLDCLQCRTDGNAVWPERLHQGDSSRSCYVSVKPINNYGGLIRGENLLSKNNWNMAPTSGTEELQWESTGNAAVNANADNAVGLGHTSIWSRQDFYDATVGRRNASRWN